MRKNGLAGCDGPDEIGSDVAIDAGEMEEKVGVGPVGGIWRKMDVFFGLDRWIGLWRGGQLVTICLSQKREKLEIWRGRDECRDLRRAVDEGKVDIIW